MEVSVKLHALVPLTLYPWQLRPFISVLREPRIVISNYWEMANTNFIDLLKHKIFLGWRDQCSKRDISCVTWKRLDKLNDEESSARLVGSPARRGRRHFEAWRQKIGMRHCSLSPLCPSSDLIPLSLSPTRSLPTSNGYPPTSHWGMTCWHNGYCPWYVWCLLLLHKGFIVWRFLRKHMYWHVTLLLEHQHFFCIQFDGTSFTLFRIHV
jgi:hypothetical protein